jgi:hypothetical protein
MVGAVGTFVSLMIVGGVIAGFPDLEQAKVAGGAGIAFIYIYDIFFSFSFAPIGWVYPSEIFSLGSRSKAMSITTSATWMCNFIIGLVTPDMLETISYGTYFFVSTPCTFQDGPLLTSLYSLLHSASSHSCLSGSSCQRPRAKVSKTWI